MSSNDGKQSIQEMEQGEKDFGILNSVQSIHKKIVGNELVSEFDVFSVPVKLTLNGQDVYQTCCGGLMYLSLIVVCAVLTLFVIFPNGVQLNSEINVVVVPNDNGDTGQTLFDHTTQVIGIKGLKKVGTVLTSVNLTGLATFKAYQVSSDNTSFPLEISSVCNDGYEFCLRNSETNKQAKIFGNYFSKGTSSKHIVLESMWCNTSVTPCPSASTYSLEISYTNLYKKKGGDLEEYKTKTYFTFTNVAYTTNVTRQVFTTNSRFFGHISNIFPSSVETYLFSDTLSKTTLVKTNLLTPGIYTTISCIQAKIVPFGTTRQINQNFDDISDIILFFFSVKETLYIVLFVIFIKQYNRNSGLLDVGRSLFYIDNPKTKKKYDFNAGYEVFIACLLHNHPITNLIHFFLTKLGRTFEDFLPNKAICAINLMRKAEEMLQQNSFYGNLNELSTMESEASKKILLREEGHEQKQQESQISYFPFLPMEPEHVKKEKEIKREAFDQFCQANEYVSPSRKNYIYKVLTNSKLKYMLVHEIQKQFKSFVRNVRVQKSDEAYNEMEVDGFSEIKVAIHDTSNHQMTAKNFIST